MSDRIQGQQDAAHRCGFVTLIGRPNVGKSTLLNKMLGQKLAITSPRPQTTRNRIPGVLTKPGVQLVFIDPPGIHRASRALNSFMVDVATEAMWETDAIALLVEAGIGPEDEVGVSPIVAQLLETLASRSTPVFLILNKIDRIEGPLLLPIIEAWRHRYPFAGIIPVSALKGEGVARLVEVLGEVMPLGPALYPEDALTDLPERFIAGELVREQLFRYLKQELPYSIAVTIESWRDKARVGLVEIDAVIHVERESQKGIVIGKGGQTLKRVGTLARKSLESLLGSKVMLKLFVRVEPAWTRSANQMRKLGYE